MPILIILLRTFIPFMILRFPLLGGLLAMLIIWKFDDKFKLSKKSLVIILLIVGIPNIIKEYIMHIKYPGQTWTFFKDNFFSWLYG